MTAAYWTAAGLVLAGLVVLVAVVPVVTRPLRRLQLAGDALRRALDPRAQRLRALAAARPRRG